MQLALLTSCTLLNMSEHNYVIVGDIIWKILVFSFLGGKRKYRQRLLQVNQSVSEQTDSGANNFLSIQRHGSKKPLTLSETKS